MASLSDTDVREAHRKGDVRSAVADYRAYHEDGEAALDARTRDYGDMVKSYYDLATDFYTFGWGHSFHFAPRYRGETFESSIARHQHYLAARLGLREGDRVLDVGCGVGGPMRGITRFSGATVVGVNNNAYQLEKARAFNDEAGLSGQTELVEADFMNLPFEDESFDAVYGIEATCHAPDKAALFAELFRVLRPGGRFGGYEWCLTDAYDERSEEHRRIKQGIEEGDGLPDIWTTDDTLDALTQAGFVVEQSEDRAPTSDEETPWYLPISGRERTFLGVRRHPVGRRLTWGALLVAEKARLVPRGTWQVSQFLHAGADALVEGGERGIFTPMFFFLATKP